MFHSHWRVQKDHADVTTDANKNYGIAAILFQRNIGISYSAILSKRGLGET